MTRMSTELIEESLPDVGSRSVGIVQTQSATLFAPPNPLVLTNSRSLGPITVAYETYGQLSPRRDNAIFVCHALTGDAHAAGYRSKEDLAARKAGWWDGFIGPGKGLDTDKYFVICANVLGGCQGTTGPSSICPETGQPWGRDFPVITVEDMVSVHAELVRLLGIERLLAVGGRQPGRNAGPRMGGAVSRANRLGDGAGLECPSVGSGDRLQQRRPGGHHGRSELHQRRLLRRIGPAQRDWHWPGWSAHITYLSEASIENKFGRRLQDASNFTFDLIKEVEFQVRELSALPGPPLRRSLRREQLHLPDEGDGLLRPGEDLRLAERGFCPGAWRGSWSFRTTATGSIPRRRAKKSCIRSSRRASTSRTSSCTAPRVTTPF